MKTAIDRNQLAKQTVKALHQLYPDADCALEYTQAHELLIATILSAQSTDATVNKVTKTVFEKYRTIQDFAIADPEEFEVEIYSTGFFRNKTKSVIGAANMIVEEFDGKVPDTMEDLLKLPGVARKTANVVLGTYFKKAEGIVVDTHVKRVSYRIGLTDHTDPEKIERDLMEVFPRDEWIFVGHALILHGRNICVARGPKIEICLLNDFCLQRGVKTPS
ncbi:MAG: endonuclease III [Rhodothermales bacterium]